MHSDFDDTGPSCRFYEDACANVADHMDSLNAVWATLFGLFGMTFFQRLSELVMFVEATFGGALAYFANRLRLRYFICALSPVAFFGSLANSSVPSSMASNKRTKWKAKNRSAKKSTNRTWEAHPLLQEQTDPVDIFREGHRGGSSQAYMIGNIRRGTRLT